MAKQTEREDQDYSINSNCFYSDRFLAARYQTSRQTVWAWASAGRFPKPVKLSPQCSRWRGCDVLEHESKLVEAVA